MIQKGRIVFAKQYYPVSPRLYVFTQSSFEVFQIQVPIATNGQKDGSAEESTPRDSVQHVLHDKASFLMQICCEMLLNEINMISADKAGLR